MNIFLIFFLLLFISWGVTGQQSFNYIDINNNTNYSGLDILDEEGEKYNFYFSGENHLFSTTNSKLEFKLLAYFHEKHNVNNMVLEFGYGSGWLVNQFVNNNNSEIKKIINLYFSDDFMDLFNDIKTYNNKLKNDSISITGIDIQRSSEISFEVLNLLFPPDSVTVPDSIKQEIELIKFVQGYIRKSAENYNKNGSSGLSTNYNIKNIIKTLELNYSKNKREYQTYIGQHFNDFNNIISSVFKAQKWKQYRKNKNPFASIYREQELFNNLNNLVAQYPNQKFYGQFGRAHIAKQRYTLPSFNVYNFKPLVAKINASKNPFMQNKALSIGIFYINTDGEETYKVYKNKSIKKAFQNLPIDSVAISLTNINKLDSTVKSHYQYVIVNNKSLYKEAQQIYEPAYGGYEFTYGLHEMDLGNINSFFGTNYSKKPLAFVSMDMLFFENFGAYIALGGSYYLSIKEKVNDSVDTKFNGWNIRFSMGYDVIKSDKVHLIPMLGIQYQKMNLHITQDITTNFNGINATTYKATNPAVMLDGRLNFRVKLFGSTSISLNGGYMFDLSSQKWKYEKTKLEAKNNLSGFYYSAGLALDIE